MEKQRLLWGVVAYIGMLLPVVGMVIGLIRYREYGKEVRERVEEEYHRAQERDGIQSLFYKHTGRRIFKLTFGEPILICFILGLLLMCIAFYNL